jgi:hypothetical protein
MAPDDRQPPPMDDVVSAGLTVLGGLLAIAVVADMIFHRITFVIFGLTAILGAMCLALATTAFAIIIHDYSRNDDTAQ